VWGSQDRDAEYDPKFTCHRPALEIWLSYSTV
jgi:hypothetical protein